MRTRPAPAGKSYRNEAVYRSAEQLIALTARPPAKRARFRPPLIFAAGLSLGVLVGFRAWYSPLPSTENPALIKNNSSQYTAPFSPAAAITTRLPARALPAFTTPQDTSAQDLPPPEPASPRASPKTPDTVPRPAPARSTPSTATTPVIHPTTSLVSTAEFYLYGELRSTSEPPQTVLLTLRRADGRSPDPIIGVIRFLKESLPFAGNTVAGSQDGLTLTLRETGPVWVNGDIDILPVGRRFTIAIPLSIANGEFTGTWSLGDTRGTLHLKAAATP